MINGADEININDIIKGIDWTSVVIAGITITAFAVVILLINGKSLTINFSDGGSVVFS